MTGFGTAVDERLMTSKSTAHRAVVVDGADQYDAGAWRVSWLPGIALDRDQAITAMTLTEYVSAGTTSAGHPKWPFVKGWSGELGLDPAEVVRMILAKTGDEAPAAGVFLVRDYILTVERAVVGGQWVMAGVVRGVSADVLSRIDAREAEILRMIVRVVDDVFEPNEVLLCSLYDQAGRRTDTRELNHAWTAETLGWA